MAAFDFHHPDNWIWGCVYKNADDNRIWVPKRTGLGWTLNFAHTMAYVWLGIVLATAILGSIYLPNLNLTK